ncbi:MAG: TnpV protein [Lachnospiraceae bacterium]|nr:TnpV protein [Lachnospiraceae bacterium]
MFFLKDLFLELWRSQSDARLIPNPEPEGELRKFGLMRKFYLKNHRKGIYSGLLLSGELKKYLFMI